MPQIRNKTNYTNFLLRSRYDQTKIKYGQDHGAGPSNIVHSGLQSRNVLLVRF